MEETVEPGAEATLRDYVAVLWRRKWYIALTTAVVVALAVVSSVRTTPVYEASATVLLEPRSSDTLFGNQTGGFSTDRARAVQTEISLIESEAVRQLVVAKTGRKDIPAIHGRTAGTTDVIELNVQSTDPRLAARLANAYSSAYIEFRRAQAVTNLTDASKEIAAKVVELDQKIGQTKDANERQALIEQQGVLNQEVSRLDVGSRLRGGAQLVTPARTPTSPVKPTPKRTAILGLVLGLMLGVGLAFTREYLDDTIKDHDDLERSLHGSPTIGHIPAVASWKDKAKPLLVSMSDSTSAEAESYRALRTSITFAGLERSVRTILFTSGKASEGKTTTVANLGVALARAGKSVAIIDADLRRPRINEFFEVPRDVGLTSVLVGDAVLSKALVRVGGDIGLWLLPSGPPPPNPSELLSGVRMGELVSAFSRGFDFVLIDSPPMLPVSDTVAMSVRVDAVVLVAKVRSSTRREMSRCLGLLAQVDAPLLGSVLNVMQRGATYGYGYGDGYGYAEEVARAVPSPSPVAVSDDYISVLRNIDTPSDGLPEENGTTVDEEAATDPSPR